MFRVVALIVLVAVIFFVVTYGCAFKDVESFENAKPKFESSPLDKVPSNVLTKDEKDLFDDLKSNRLKDEDIKGMVEGGQLTEKLIEKFLANLAVPPPSQTPTPTIAAPGVEENKKKENVEAFTGSMWAPW